MPVMDGPTATRAFREWEVAHAPCGTRLPVYCLTANVLEEHKDVCCAAGMDEFITKPLRRDALAELRQRAAEYAGLQDVPAG